MERRNSTKFIIFCIIGGLSALVDLFLFNSLFYLKINFIFCRIFAIFGAVIFNFFINRKFTFLSKEKAIKTQISKHFAIYGLVMMANILVSSTLFNLLGRNVIYANIASIAGIIYGIPISFIGSLLWTFKK